MGLNRFPVISHAKCGGLHVKARLTPFDCSIVGKSHVLAAWIIRFFPYNFEPGIPTAFATEYPLTKGYSVAKEVGHCPILLAESLSTTRQARGILGFIP